MVEPGMRRRKTEQDKSSADAKSSAGEKKPRIPLQGRYNPKLSDKEAVISHSMLGNQ